MSAFSARLRAAKCGSGKQETGKRPSELTHFAPWATRSAIRWDEFEEFRLQET
jgi:hypothetical protein